MNSQEISKTHNIFFEVITNKKLKELLHRADEKNKVLEGHINKKLLDDNHTDLLVKTKVKKNNKGLCSIYIYFYHKGYKNDDDYFSHISFHLYGNQYISKSKNNFGRFHIQSNINKNRRLTYRLKTNNTKNTLNIYFEHGHSILTDNMRLCNEASISIMKEYFKEGPFYLGNPLTKNSGTDHYCFNPILRSLKLKSLKNTRSKIKIPSSYNITKSKTPKPGISWKSNLFNKKEK